MKNDTKSIKYFTDTISLFNIAQNRSLLFKIRKIIKYKLLFEMYFRLRPFARNSKNRVALTKEGMDNMSMFNFWRKMLREGTYSMDNVMDSITNAGW
jgi:hypothetical protein